MTKSLRRRDNRRGVLLGVLLASADASFTRLFRRMEMPMPLFVLEPPVYYAHHYRGAVIERVLPLAEARKACAARGVSADACAWTEHGACHVIIPKNGPVRDRAAYRRHELAHCNGWDHSHASANGRDDLVNAYR